MSENNKIERLEDLFSLMERASNSGNEPERVRLLLEYFVVDARITQHPGDPFSAAYRDWVLNCHHTISGRSAYDPVRDEKIDIDPIMRAKRPGIYNDGGSHHLGTFLEAIGQIFQTANIQPGAKVLEYGPGDGQIAVNLARMGCDVTVVDIEPKYLDTILIQASHYGVPIKTVEGDFLTELKGEFDLIVFFETFHHCLDHLLLLESMQKNLSAEGRILFAGEPIIPSGSPWAPAVPFPWGLRLDALSLSAVKNYGWMELGFQEKYFEDALARTGWKSEKFESRTNGRASGYLARRFG
ncbi:MAG: methyltransferase domain-containing protein [Anaerolineae bacterium]|nr:MAG: methyltransferase domain-containing protein [Anaerolineae bacterium]